MLVVRYRALTLQPKVRRRGRQLSATTSWPVRLLTLGGYASTVHVDGDAGYVYVQRRRFWFFVESRVVPFTKIARIRYDFRELPTSFSRRGHIHDTLEAFHVELELVGTEERVHLTTFFGEGAADGLAGWLYGDATLDMEGTQEADSRSFVDQLCELTGASLSKPFAPVRDTSGHAWSCSSCQRKVPPRPKCLYCGGQAGPLPPDRR